jgi:amino-acid N-acetyltransferase
LRLRRAEERDVAPLLDLINGYAQRNLLLGRTEESVRSRLADFLVAEEDGEVVGCGALTELGPGLGEVRSLAVREDQAGHGIGHKIVEALLARAGDRGFAEVLALTRRVGFFEALGFTVTRRERFLDKLQTDCQHCPLNLCCDETAMVRVAPRALAAAPRGMRRPRGVALPLGRARVGSSPEQMAPVVGLALKEHPE